MASRNSHYPGDEAVVELSRTLRGKMQEFLNRLVSIPSLSIPGSDPEVLRFSAEVVKDHFAPLLKWDSIEIVSAGGGAPAVIARKNPSPGFPTVLLYAHHDVQPAGDERSWQSPAFEAVERNGRLYGRGSADDGAGIVVHHHALSVLTTLFPASPGLGVVVFIEGEEESGSPTFRALLDQHRDLLEADLIVVADSDNPALDSPALTTSLRGVVGVTLTLRTLNTSVHSGMFGGPIPDALTSLIRLLATLHHPDGSVAINGLDVPVPGSLAAVGEHEFREEAGLLPGISLWGQGGLSERLWWQPALSITGIDAPATAQASNTLLAVASAKVSLRIPPGVSTEQAQQALIGHLRAHCPTGVELGFEHWELGDGFSQEPDHPLIQPVVTALEDGFGHKVVFQGVGGSIPFVAHLAEAFPHAAIAITGVEDRHSAAHGPNESVDLEMLNRAALSEALLLSRLASGV